jgi:hypothetical protein
MDLVVFAGDRHVLARAAGRGGSAPTMRWLSRPRPTRRRPLDRERRPGVPLSEGLEAGKAVRAARAAPARSSRASPGRQVRVGFFFGGAPPAVPADPGPAYALPIRASQKQRGLRALLVKVFLTTTLGGRDPSPFSSRLRGLLQETISHRPTSCATVASREQAFVSG